MSIERRLAALEQRFAAAPGYEPIDPSILAEWDEQHRYFEQHPDELDAVVAQLEAWLTSPEGAALLARPDRAAALDAHLEAVL